MDKVQEMLIENKNLINVILRTKFPDYCADDDAIQVGLIALWEAAQKYEEARNTSFRTFASRCITNAIYDEIRRRKHSDESVDITDYDFKDEMMSIEDKIIFYDALSRLGEEREVITRRMEGYTFGEIAEDLNKSERTVKRLQEKGHMKIKRYYDGEDE